MTDTLPIVGTPAPASNNPPGERPVQLADGSTVSSYSEAYRHECEARWLLGMPLEDRRAMLYGTWTDVFMPGQRKKQERRGGIIKTRGVDEAKRLEVTLMVIWKLQKRRAAA